MTKCLNLTSNDRKILIRGLSLLIDDEGDSIDRTKLYNKLKSCR